jgi:hypothetical protein
MEDIHGAVQYQPVDNNSALEYQPGETVKEEIASEKARQVWLGSPRAKARARARRFSR